jgi:hypothetical protein
MNIRPVAFKDREKTVALLRKRAVFNEEESTAAIV